MGTKNGITINGFRTNISSKSIAEQVNDLVKAMKKKCKESKQGLNTFVVDTYQRGYGERPFGSGHEERERKGDCLTTHIFKCGGQEIELNSLYKMEEFSNALEKELQKIKNFFYSKKPYYVSHGYSSVTYHFLDNVVYLTPCKEWNTLKNYLTKYGKGDDLKESDFYSCEIFGKRGVFDEEDGVKTYKCTNSTWCTKALETIRKYRGSKDNMVFSTKKCDIYDEEDLRHSRYAETECYGQRVSRLYVTITTSSGKVKYNSYV